MDDAELVGGALFYADDPRSASRALANFLRSPGVEHPEVVRHAGLDPGLVQVLRHRLSATPERFDSLCAEGAAWVLGRRSAAVTDPWELVASLPAGARLPEGVRRTTGETLLSLTSGARRSLRLTAPFVDDAALRFLANALVAATARSVHVEIFSPTRSTRATEAMSGLLAHVRAEGSQDHFRITAYRDDAPWAHLKVLTADSAAAYIGSANVTGAALAGANLELGVLVRGPDVRAIEAILDLFRSSV